MKRKLLRVGVVLALTCGMLVGFAASALASRPACGAFAASFAGDGTVYVGSKIEGGGGQMITQQAHLCTSDNGAGNSSSQWVLIVANNSGSNGTTYHYAQSGAITEADIGTCARYYAEWGEGATGGNFISATCATINSSHHFHTDYTLSCGCYKLYVDTTAYLVTPWNPFTTWAEPFNIETTQEVHFSAGSDAPGTVTAKSDIHAIQYQNYVTDAFVDACTASTGVSATGITGPVIQWPNPPGGTPRITATLVSCSHMQGWNVTP